MNHKRTYAVEPQRRIGMGDAAWTLCLPSEAERFALIEMTVWQGPRKAHGRRSQFRKRRVLSSFDNEPAANEALAVQLRKK